MKLFKLNPDRSLEIDDVAWGLEPFKKLIKRDKSKNKAKALKEMLFVYFYCDVRSDYLIISEKDRTEEIKKEVGLPEDWKIDSIMQEAIDFYKKRSKTIAEKLYEKSVKAANDIADYLEETDQLLRERDSNGKVVTDITKATGSLTKISKIMDDLDGAYERVVKEKEKSEKKQGSRTHGLFEDGI